MAKKKNDISRWIGLCKLGIEERKRKQPDWDTLNKYLQGEQWGKDIKEDYHIVVVNMVYGHLKVVLPTVYPNNPKLFFNPNNAATVDKARLNEAIFNADMERMRLKQTNRRIIQDVIIIGTGFSKTTFEIPDYSVDIRDEPILKEVQNNFKDVPAASVEGGSIAIPKSYPRCVRVAPGDLVTALGVTDFDDPGFIGHHVRKRLISIKNDDFYKNTSDLQPTWEASSDLLSSLTSGTLVQGGDELLSMVDLWEIWDVENQEWFVIAEGHDRYLVEPRDNIYPYDHPFDRLVYTELEDQIWGLGEILPWLNQQDELNLVRTQQINHLKRYNRKYAVRQTHIQDGEDGVLRLQTGEDGTVVFVQGDRTIDDIIKPIADANMPADVFRVNAIIEDDIVKIGGLTPYRRGGTVGANTATEANIAEGNAQVRDKERIDLTADFVLRQMEKVRKGRAEFTTTQEIIDVTKNPLDADRWQTWSKDSIDLESEMKVSFGPATPLNEQERIQRAMLLYDRALANPTVNPQSAFSNLLQAFEERDQTAWFLPNILIQLHLLQKAVQNQKDQTGVSPQGGAQSTPGAETPAELSGRGVTTETAA